jgi:DNA mismatch repair protein MutL
MLAYGPMSGRIFVLPPELVNQIAAGEVVERPASVVKELIENSLDAGAHSVFCRVEEGGRRLVRTVDDGEGMSPEDLQLAVMRHATSKIKSSEDLSRIGTLGFRGEALPSIAAVSRLLLTTRRREEQAGTRLQLAGGGKPEVSTVGAPVGTDVEVRDLFFNTPARRKFLRTSATEMGHIQAWFTRLGLLRPEVHFRLEHGGRMLCDAPPAPDLAQRAAVLLGREVFEHLFEVAYRQDGLGIQGLVSSPEHSRSNARWIFLFVNGRFVRDRLLLHAVMEGYRTVLPPGRFPVVILQLQMDPEKVDVNVHPQKTEVRFEDTQEIHRAFTVAVAEVLAKAPWVRGKPSRTYVVHKAPERAAGVREALARYNASASRGTRSFSWTPQEPSREELPMHEWRLVGTLWDTYLLVAHGDRLVVVDQHAAAERIAFERMRRSLDAGRVQVQRLLVPEQIELDAGAVLVFQSQRERIVQVGFEMEPFGPAVVNVTAVPALLTEAPLKTLVRDVLDELSDVGPGAPWEKARLEVIGRMACHASVRAGQSLSGEKVRALLMQLEEIDFAGTCPHGRPVLAEFDKSEVARWFLRT